MNYNFSAIDLSRLKAPDVVEKLDYETILEQWKNEFLKNYSDKEFDLDLESEPVVKLMETGAYRELLLRQRINDSAREVMLAHAKGSNLDNLGILLGVERKIEIPGSPDSVPPVPPQYESDEKLRKRIQLAPEGYSTAGPEGAYIFHAFSASPYVTDVSVDAPEFENAQIDESLLPENTFAYKAVYNPGIESPRPGDVVVTILIKDHESVNRADVLNAVRQRLSHEDIRPLTDRVIIREAETVPYEVEAVLIINKGPGRESAIKNSRTKLVEFVEENKKLGSTISLSGLYSALHGPGVEKVELKKPQNEITTGPGEAPVCINISVTAGDYNEN